MATVFSDRGHGARGPSVFYNRANEAAARLLLAFVDSERRFMRVGNIERFSEEPILIAEDENQGPS